MKKTTSMIALAGAASLVIAGCANSDDKKEEAPKADSTTSTSTESTTTEAEKPAAAENARDYAAIDASGYKACLVSDAGGWDDRSFNESAYNGLQSAIDLMKVKHQTAESTTEEDFDRNVDSLIADGCDVIIGVGFSLEEAIHKAADANKDLKFSLVDSGFQNAEREPVTLENGRPLLFNTAEAAFLGGYLSAGMTQTGTVATFGGLPIPSVQVFMDGFYDGVMAYNEAHGTDIKLLGWDKKTQTGSFSQSFDDQSKGQQIAEGFISQGADIIMPVAGPVGLGAAAAAKSAGGVMIVGVDSDWYESAPQFSELVLTSVQKEIAASVLDTIADLAEGKFNSDPYVGTLENGGVGLAPFHDYEKDVPKELVQEVEDLKAKIISGELKIESDNTP